MPKPLADGAQPQLQPFKWNGSDDRRHVKEHQERQIQTVDISAKAKGRVAEIVDGDAPCRRGAGKARAQLADLLAYLLDGRS